MSETTKILYGRTRDGFLAASVGKQAFAMLPQQEGFHVAKAWGLAATLEDWTSADFPPGGGDPVDETEFRRQVEEWATHQTQLAALDRRSIASHVMTPWGASQHAVVYAEGIVAHHTASHGGFAVSAGRNAAIPDLLRTDDGFYEEDCAWAAVAVAFPALFTDFEKRHADETIRHLWPDAWEAFHGVPLQPGQSRARDRKLFDTENAGRWVVISAILSTQNPGFVECIAKLGGRGQGRRGTGSGEPKERRFLVHEDRYDIGAFGFVIDEAVDEAYDGPSSFVGWAKRP